MTERERESFERLRDLLDAHAQERELDDTLIAALADEAGVGVHSKPQAYVYQRDILQGYAVLLYAPTAPPHAAVFVRVFRRSRFAWQLFLPA